MFDLHETLPKYLRMILNKFEAVTNLANGPIICTYYAQSELLSSSTKNICKLHH